MAIDIRDQNSRMSRLAMPIVEEVDAPLVVSTINSIAAMEQVMADWMEMIQEGADGAAATNDPRMIAAMVRHQSGLKLHIITIRRGERLACIVPCYIQQSRFEMKLSVWQLAAPRARILRIFGEQVIFARGANVDDCVALAFASIREAQDGFDFMWIDGFRQESQFAEAGVCIRSAAKLHGMITVSLRSELIHRIHLPESVEKYVASLSPSTRQNLRRTTRRFFDDGEAKFVTVTDPTDVSKLLEWMDRIHLKSWQGRVFAQRERANESLAALLQEIADCGWLRSYVLLKNSAPVAFEYGYLYQGTYYGLDCAYDLEWASSGPGSILMFHAVQDLISQCHAKLVDFGLGDLPYKRSFGNVTQQVDLLYAVPQSRWRPVIRGQRVLNAIDDAARTFLVRMKADRFVRKWIKQQR